MAKGKRSGEQKPRRKRLPRWLFLRIRAERRLLQDAERMDAEIRRMARDG